MEKRGYNNVKLWENLASEILDVCQLDVTGKSVGAAVSEVLAVLDGKQQCQIGRVDWLGTLEQEGKIGEYLRV